VLTTNDTHYIEFVPSSGGGRYRGDADGSAGGNFLSYTDTTDLTFDVLGKLPSNPSIAVNDYVVVYNLGEGYAPANVYVAADPCTSCNRAKVSSLSGNTVTLTSNPFAAQSPPMPSPSYRFQVVPGATRAVTYACPSTTAGSIYRYANYGFNATQTAPSGTPALLATGAVCSVEYTNNATGRNGLLYVRLTLTQALSGESATLLQQIHVDNAP
jgi:MSHA biogenesis protein MshO